MNTINAEIWSFPQIPTGYFTKDYVYDLIVGYIEQGILQPGLRLPPYRAVAKLNGFQKTTMQLIYKSLVEDGWLEPIKGSATFVALNFPGNKQIYPTTRAVKRLPVSLGLPDDYKIKEHCYFHDFVTIGLDTPGSHYLKQWLNLFKMQKYAVVYDINSQTSRVAALKGTRLNTEILTYLNLRRNFKIEASNLEVIVGRRESLEHLFSTLLKPGDVMVNTSPKDRKLCKILNAQTAVENVVIIVDHSFLESLKSILSTTKIKALYIRPQCSYPESNTLSSEACIALVELAKQYGFYIIEEDDYHEFWYEKIPFKPLVCHDHKGHVIYTGALSIISSYLQQTRTIVAAAEFITLMKHKAIIHSTFRDVIIEAIMVDVLATNSLWRAVKQMQQDKKRHRFEAWLQMENALNKAVKVTKPSGGLSLWLTFRNDECLKNAIVQLETKGFKIPYFPGTQKPGKGVNHIRLGFGTWDMKEVNAPVKVLIETFGLEC